MRLFSNLTINHGFYERKTVIYIYIGIYIYKFVIPSPHFVSVVGRNPYAANLEATNALEENLPHVIDSHN